MSFKVVKDESVEVFFETAKEILYQNEIENSLMIGLCENMLIGEMSKEALFLRILKDGKTVNCSLQTPKMSLIVDLAEKEELEALAEYLYDEKVFIPGCIGPAKRAEEFGKCYSKLFQKSMYLEMPQKIYKIDQVIMPSCIENVSMRKAEEKDIEILSRWYTSYGKECLPANEWHSLEENERRVFASIQNGLIYVLEQNTKYLSMAYRGRETRNTCTVYGVYTPIDLRKNGYASLLVALLSQNILDSSKKYPVLYTDLRNKTSNNIYQKIGYREVCASSLYFFR